MEEEKKVGGSRPRVIRPRKTVSYEEQQGSFERRSAEEHRPYSDRSRSEGSDRPYRPHNDGPRKSYGSRPSYGDRPQRSYGDRPQRQFGDGERRSYGDRPQRSYGDRQQRPYGDRPQRQFGDGEHRPYGDRPQRSYGDRQQRPYGDRPAKPFGSRSSYGDRSQKSFGGRKPFRKKFEANFDEREESGINRMLSRKSAQDAARLSDADTVATEIRSEMRLNRFIANSGVCSRREADTLIQAGVVTVNGEVVTELGTKVNVFEDDVRFNGERLKGEEKVYVVMNKPKGYVTSVSDPHAEKTVMDLLKGCSSRIFPVGRLDKATTGVLMFTNDGEMAEKLTHPSYDKKKIYQVILDHNLTDEDYQKILSGITLSDGEIKADELEFIDEHDHRRLGIEIHSGKNRIVRRIFESLGYDVKALDRVYFAGLTKKGLQKGEWRYLSEGEVNILKMGAYV